MNPSPAPRSFWNVLAQRAQDQIDTIDQHLTQAKLRVQQLQDSHQRLLNLYQDYARQVHGDGQYSQGMSQNMELRQFMSQLCALRDRVQTDITHTRNQIEGLLERRTEAEHQRLKMSTLAERDQTIWLTEVRKKEQRQMDELGVQMFNRQTAR